MHPDGFPPQHFSAEIMDLINLFTSLLIISPKWHKQRNRDLHLILLVQCLVHFRLSVSTYRMHNKMAVYSFSERPSLCGMQKLLTAPNTKKVLKGPCSEKENVKLVSLLLMVAWNW